MSGRTLNCIIWRRDHTDSLIIWINEVQYRPQNLKKKQINGRFKIIDSLMRINTRLYCGRFLLGQKLISRVSLIRLKPVSDMFLRGFSLSSAPPPPPTLKVLLL
jgi:hypothetical protein